MYIYSVWDKVMKSFAPPFIAKNDGVAVRNFMIGAKKLPNVDDLQLFRIGVWNDEDVHLSTMTEAVEVPINMDGDDE